MSEQISKFSAMMSRMKYIDRWALMRNSRKENISEHSMEVAMLAHLLAVIGNTRFGKQLDVQRAALIGLYHDCTEIITGDMPTPVKYYSEEMRDTFKNIEDVAANQLLELLPQDIRAAYESLFFPPAEDAYLCRLVKAADTLSALIKCYEEETMQNAEFTYARKATEAALDQMKLEELDVFREEFMPAYRMTLDELRER